MSNRFEAISVDTHQLYQIQLVKDLAYSLEAILKEYPNREAAVALTNLETTIMWVNKAIARAGN